MRSSSPYSRGARSKPFCNLLSSSSTSLFLLLCHANTWPLTRAMQSQHFSWHGHIFYFSLCLPVILFPTFPVSLIYHIKLTLPGSDSRSHKTTLTTFTAREGSVPVKHHSSLTRTVLILADVTPIINFPLRTVAPQTPFWARSDAPQAGNYS